MWALFLYIVITIVGCVVLALPGVTFAVIAGVLFGPFMGIAACLTATTLGAMSAFLAGRFFLKDAVKPMLEKNKLLKRLLFSEDGKSDMIVLMITRMVPLFPYNLQNFAYGITDIGFLKYSAFTFIFMLPGVSFFTIGSAGLTAEEGKWKYFLVAGILAAAVTAAGIAIQRKFLGSQKEASGEEQMSQAVILFTRVPVPGQTKTRLMPFLSGEECAALHTMLIRSAYEACLGTDADILVWYTPEEQSAGIRELTEKAKGFFPQKGNGLGERMSRAFAECFEMGYEKVLLTGTDIPELSSEILRWAFCALEEYDAVINPTEDGGYYLIGLKEAVNGIFDVPRYGTDTVFQDTLARLEAAGLTSCVGKACRDIDTKEDLTAWYGVDRCVRCGTCTKNCRFLGKYKLNLAELAVRPELSWSCFFCGRCKTVCPKKIDGSRIALLNRNLGADRTSYRWLLWEKNPYRFANYRRGGTRSVLFPGCNFTAFYPKTVTYLERLMKKHGIGTVYDCCGKPVYELGLQRDAEKSLERISKRLKEQKTEELIVICPGCYHFLKDRLDIPVVTIYRKLNELGEGRKVKREQIPLYYPCPDRENKEMQKELSVYLEGEITEPFDGIQCCGLGGCAQAGEKILAKEMAESVRECSEEVYTYCASCVSNFKRNGMGEAYHVLPLILGIEEKVPVGIRPFINRAGRKIT